MSDGAVNRRDNVILLALGAEPSSEHEEVTPGQVDDAVALAAPDGQHPERTGVVAPSAEAFPEMPMPSHAHSAMTSGDDGLQCVSDPDASAGPCHGAAEAVPEGPHAEVALLGDPPGEQPPATDPAGAPAEGPQRGEVFAGAKGELSSASAPAVGTGISTAAGEADPAGLPTTRHGPIEDPKPGAAEVGIIEEEASLITSAVSSGRGRKKRRMPHYLGIEVSDLVLRYPVGAARRGSLKSGVLGLFGHREANAGIQHIAAIRGISFRVELGERVGIIGRNGSGKSSLLRVLAGVFPVESGNVRVQGEIGSLLDIGLGFETESTGRENIYNRGFAMGRSHKELKAAEAEIIAHADLGEFIDLPMRTYSSGMFVRLGFAISTQFTPDVLLVDEVFGAGDAAFAKRAQKRIRHMTANAGILVLVSHDFGAILENCTRVIWMDRGRIIADGNPQEVVSNYLSTTAAAPEAEKE